MSFKQKKCYSDHATAFSLDYSGMDYKTAELDDLAFRFIQVHKEMQKIEAGEIKNPDENRKVTHFTDRKTYGQENLYADVETFTAKIRSGAIAAEKGKFSSVIINGIGGSALGPQLMQMTMNGPYWNELPDEARDGFPKIYFLDNTDPAGLKDVLSVVDLNTALVVTISKSGGTKETANNLTAIQSEYRTQDLDFAPHAVAITMVNSKLYRKAQDENWLKVFPLADSIGGRTSETSIVGHLPAALTGIDFSQFLQGACYMDVLTRTQEFSENPAYLLAGLWYLSGDGLGNKNMVVVPYSDRLILFSRYLQQLVMESLGKEFDLKGEKVEQGLNVFGNKGGTDAHAFIQQLNDGRNDFFLTFISILNNPVDYDLEDGLFMSDYLYAFEKGLKDALVSKGRQAMQIRIKTLDEWNLGMLVALFERAVAAYAELIGVNAFHQPGVEAYKKASDQIMSDLVEIRQKLEKVRNWQGTLLELSDLIRFSGGASILEDILTKFIENTGTEVYGEKRISRQLDNAENWIYKII